MKFFSTHFKKFTDGLVNDGRERRRRRRPDDGQNPLEVFRNETRAQEDEVGVEVVEQQRRSHLVVGPVLGEVDQKLGYGRRHARPETLENLNF